MPLTEKWLFLDRKRHPIKQLHKMKVVEHIFQTERSELRYNKSHWEARGLMSKVKNGHFRQIEASEQKVAEIKVAKLIFHSAQNKKNMAKVAHNRCSAPQKFL